jgi:hypothetical protein
MGSTMISESNPNTTSVSIRSLGESKVLHVIKPLSPGLFHSVYDRARSLKSLERNILKMAGIKPVHHMMIGLVEGIAQTRQEWLDELCGAGEAGN